MRFRRFTVAAGLLAATAAVAAAPPPDPEDLPPLVPEAVRTPTLRPVIGVLTTAVTQHQGDTMLDVARRKRLGFSNVQRLNPGVEVWIPEPGTAMTLPTRYILPDVDARGLVVNIPEMRMYDFRQEPPEVYAVAIGDPEEPTPVGRFRVGERRRNPEWRVPKSIREERPELPEVVPPGAGNPLGSRWLRLGNSTYGIHGTNVVWSIGRYATHGCIRLYEDEMERLFDRTPLGTPVEVIYSPYKWGTDGRVLYFEAHPDLYGRVADALELAMAVPRALEIVEQVDEEKVRQAIEEARGVPIEVGTLPARVTSEKGGLTSSPSG